jgi:predicted phosphodiesterase
VLAVRSYLSAQSMRFARHVLLGMLCLIFLALPQIGLLPQAGAAAPLAAWVELIGPGSEASIRAVVPAEADCPAVIADGEPIPMRVRADPGPLFPPGKTPGAEFPVRVCELIAPRGKTSLTLEGLKLPLPVADPQRIVIFGDTGCRMKLTRLQDCGQAWDYPAIAKHAAESRPDLVIHLGDYLYRESCTGSPVCQQRPTGYDWKIWNSDFFEPSSALFAAAPWIMVRGNHEICDRAGEGWFRFLDHAPVPPECIAMSAFFVVEPGNLGFVVVDSAQIAREPGRAPNKPRDDPVGKLQAFYAAVESAIPAPAWMLTHVPFNAPVRTFAGTIVSDTIQHRAIGERLSRNIKMIASGHVHLFEALSFGGDTPPPAQLVVGTGGTELDAPPDELSKINGSPVHNAFIRGHFGYMVWNRDGPNWNGELHDQLGQPLAHCRLMERELSCQEN